MLRAQIILGETAMGKIPGRICSPTDSLPDTPQQMLTGDSGARFCQFLSEYFCFIIITEGMTRITAALLMTLCCCNGLTVSLDGPAALIHIIVGDDTQSARTYVSELYLKRAGVLATSNIVFNFSQVDPGNWSNSRLSSSAVSVLME
jgi:hypothetical protein